MATEQEAIRAAVAPALRLLGVLFLLSGAWSTSAASPGAPVCAGSRELVVLGEALGFCSGDGGVSCCDAADDVGLRAELEGMRISDATCAAIVKAFLCTGMRDVRSSPPPIPEDAGRRVINRAHADA
ncbi:HIPL2 protein-like [Miscanthus floridulus]|uniref:HIPL2 protein-like n=1 Tax=Miscanthus floridulus TaxID=154761 RepID=UPI0034577550